MSHPTHLHMSADAGMVFLARRVRGCSFAYLSSCAVVVDVVVDVVVVTH